VTEEPVIEIES